MSTLQNRIKERRLSLNLTLLDVAEQLGVREATVQRYESGEIKNIKHETIVQLAKILDCSPSYLMGWEDSLPQDSSSHEKEPPAYAEGSKKQRVMYLLDQLNDEGVEKVLEMLPVIFPELREDNQN